MSQTSQGVCFTKCPFSDAAVPGLTAIHEKEIRNRILFQPPLKDTDVSSVDIDATMRTEYPRAERWDYGICYGKKTMKIAFIEVHKAESGEVEKLLAKRRWLKEITVGAISSEPDWYWMATSKVKIHPQSRYMRLLQKEKIRMIAKNLILE